MPYMGVERVRFVRWIAGDTQVNILRDSPFGAFRGGKCLDMSAYRAKVGMPVDMSSLRWAIGQTRLRGIEGERVLGGTATGVKPQAE